MAWTTPVTATVGQVLTAAFYNTYVRDNLLFLRFLKGRIRGSDGVTLAGAGFTSGRNSTGDYTITFSVAFANVPVVLATVAQTAAGSPLFALSYGAGTTSVGINVFTDAGVASDPVGFHLIASDPSL